MLLTKGNGKKTLTELGRKLLKYTGAEHLKTDFKRFCCMDM
jgi:hypothetical protein